MHQDEKSVILFLHPAVLSGNILCVAVDELEVSEFGNKDPPFFLCSVSGFFHFSLNIWKDTLQKQDHIAMRAC